MSNIKIGSLVSPVGYRDPRIGTFGLMVHQDKFVPYWFHVYWFSLGKTTTGWDNDSLKLVSE